MNGLQQLETTLKNPTTWQVTFGMGCLITAAALFVLAANSVQFGHFAERLPFCNTLASFDMTKTVGLLAGGGALCGLALFLFKRIITSQIRAKLEKKELSQRANKAIKLSRSLHRLITVIALIAGAALIAYGIFYISNLRQDILLNAIGHGTHVAYLANESQLKEIFLAIASGGFLFSWGLLEIARRKSSDIIE